MAGKGLIARLGEGPVICAEGYLFELERRGYLQAGAFVPEAVLDHPEVVEQLHRDFVHAGSDVVANLIAPPDTGTDQVVNNDVVANLVAPPDTGPDQEADQEADQVNLNDVVANLVAPPDASSD